MLLLGGGGGWGGGGGGGGCGVFFFFKQKTAYEIGTGDWSSDVCSSDLGLRFLAPFGRLSGFPDWPGLKRDAAGGFAYQTSYLVGRIASTLAGSFSYSSFIRPPPTSGWTEAIRRPRVPPHLAHTPPIAPGCGRNTSGQVCRGTRLALRPPVSYLFSRCASVQGIHVLLS